MLGLVLLSWGWSFGVGCVVRVDGVLVVVGMVEVGVMVVMFFFLRFCAFFGGWFLLERMRELVQETVVVWLCGWRCGLLFGRFRLGIRFLVVVDELVEDFGHRHRVGGLGISQ